SPDATSCPVDISRRTPGKASSEPCAVERFKKRAPHESNARMTRLGCPAYDPTASVTHFLVKLVFAAPESFLPEACLSQALFASFSHLVMKLFCAAPESFLSADCILQLACCALTAVPIRRNAATKNMTLMSTSKARSTRLSLRSAVANIELASSKPLIG